MMMVLGMPLERFSKDCQKATQDCLYAAKTNSGHGPTILLGYRENSDCAWVFQMDSDDEMGPEFIWLAMARTQQI